SMEISRRLALSTVRGYAASILPNHGRCSDRRAGELIYCSVLSKPSPVVRSETLNLALSQFRRDCPHSGIDIVAPPAGCTERQLLNEILCPLLRQDERLDGPPRTRAMASGARRNVALRIAQFHELHDRRR